MSAVPPAGPVDQDVFARRQKRLLVLAWSVTILPLVAFAYLTWQAWELNKQVHSSQLEIGKLSDKKAGVEKELDQLNKKQATVQAELAQLTEKLVAQRGATKHYRDLAGIRIQFYREEDRAIVERALDELGFRIESGLGASRLINLKANTIAYGNQVSDKDLRDIAIALVEKGFPLKRIAPALKQPDPKLIQIYASAPSDKGCGLLSVEQIRAGRTCGEASR
jgi:cell division protein FtsB